LTWQPAWQSKPGQGLFAFDLGFFRSAPGYLFFFLIPVRFMNPVSIDGSSAPIRRRDKDLVWQGHAFLENSDFLENIPPRRSSTGVMDEALKRQWQPAQRDPGSEPAQFSPDGIADQRISDALHRNYSRLRKFIQKRVGDRSEAEDILQDVFYELVEAYRMMNPIEQVTGWLFRVARNRITDLFRRKQREEQRNAPVPIREDGVAANLEELLPSPDAGPEALYIRGLLLDEIDSALDDLPEEQREVFVAHELMGYSFNDISAQTGVSVNTLLSRKHYAVVELRKRLRAVYDEFLNRG